MSDAASRWIADNQSLAQACTQLANSATIAVDTEFMRTNTFFPIAALFQLSDGEQSFLVDPLPIDDFSPMVVLFTNPKVTKVLHSCSEDMEVFRNFLGCIPEPLVDTQIAASFVGHGLSVGYAALVSEALNIQLDKGETRSNWLQRPLSASQRHYAEQDVAHLLRVYQWLMEKLAQAGRTQWLTEDNQALLAASKKPEPSTLYYRRIKAAWRLSSQQLAVLKQLSDWREQCAREKDKPRNHIVSEDILLLLAQTQPTTAAALATLKIPESKISPYSATLLELIKTAQVMPPEQWPPVLPGPLPLAQKKLMKALKEIITKRAATLAVEASVLVRKNDLIELVRSGTNGQWQLPERLAGWRKAVVGDELLAIAKSMETAS